MARLILLAALVVATMTPGGTAFALSSASAQPSAATKIVGASIGPAAFGPLLPPKCWGGRRCM
jgi:hypothetical protein